MADYSTCIKELQNDIKSNAEAIDEIQTQMQTQFRLAEATNADRFHLLHEALDALIKKQTHSSESSHGALNSNRQPFQMDFGPSVYDCPRAALFKLNQSGSVGEYYTEFNKLANRVYGVSTEALLDCFLSGLQNDIRRDVLALSPDTITRAFALAKLYEEKYTTQPKTRSTQSPYKSPNHNTTYPQKNYPNITRSETTPNHSHPKTQLPPLLPTPNQKPTAIRNISPAEMQIRRDKGLCYFCDENFSHTHRCPNRRVMMLQLTEDEGDNCEPEPPDDEHNHSI
ncbi:hypothetical protein A2U01_0019992 [Trifolium medium]|uniref:Retrotransposon gag domain-containing protein n=1 Tax=Trifolium medium TaxID=97028 RepID=A0A392NGU4_9FABA|nr:hypothetical protein [Trifolium medium]